MAVRKPHPINPNTLAPKRSDQPRVRADILKLGSLFVLLVSISAGLYYFGTGRNGGIQPTFDTDSSTPHVDVGVLDCFHFSVVTIATLGYGDYRPVGWGRIVAAIEVVVGVILTGVFISRLVSAQQERLTKRLLGGQMNGEVQDFRELLSGVLIAFSELEAAPQKNDAVVAPVDERVSSLLNNSAGLAKSLARYWRHEATIPDLALIVPARATGRMLGEIYQLLESIEKAIDGHTAKTVGENNRIHIRNIAESSLAIADVLESRVSDAGLSHSAARIYAVVARLRTQLKLKRMWVK